MKKCAESVRTRLNLVFTASCERWWFGKQRWCGFVHDQGRGLRRCVCHRRSAATAWAQTCWDASVPPPYGHLDDRAGTACQRQAPPPLRHLRKKQKVSVVYVTRHEPQSTHVMVSLAYRWLCRPCCSHSSAGRELKMVCPSGWKDLAIHWWRNLRARLPSPSQPQCLTTPVWTLASEIYAPRWCLKGSNTDTHIKLQINLDLLNSLAY